MSFTGHKMTQFGHRIVDLPDQPNLPADELKARFDSSPEELRQAVNGICDDATTLESRVDGIVEGSFAGAVTEALLAPELAAKLNGAATTAAVTAQVSAETTARESADDALDARVDALETSVPQKCQLHTAGYVGNGAASRYIIIGWRPRAVLLMQHARYLMVGNIVSGGLITDGTPLRLDGEICAEVDDSGFHVYQNGNIQMNSSGAPYDFIAFR